MTFAELRTELEDRGFSKVPATRLENFINRAYSDICEEADWPFLEATSTGAPPLTISDLRTIESVIDTTNKTRLSPLDRRNIMEDDYTLSTTGTPAWYYLTTGTTVAVYPANTGVSLSVRYWKFPTALSALTDTPVIPTRFQPLIVDCAAYYAYIDARDYEGAGAANEMRHRGLTLMREALLVGQHDQADDYIWATNSVDW